MPTSRSSQPRPRWWIAAADPDAGHIDSHVHAVLSEVVILNLEQIPLTLMTARAADLLRRMLDRGFTTVRDTLAERTGA